MKSKQEMKDLIDFLRSEGVYEYEFDGIRLTLSPNRPDTSEPAKTATVQKRDKIYNMTAEEQEDLFSAVVSPVE